MISTRRQDVPRQERINSCLNVDAVTDDALLVGCMPKVLRCALLGVTFHGEVGMFRP